MAGNVDFYFGNTSVLLAQRDHPAIRLLAVGTAERVASAPDLPPASETVPGFVFASWNGFLVPNGTPDAIVEKLRDAITAWVKTPDVSGRLNNLGIIPGGQTKAQVAAAFASDRKNLAEAVKAAGIPPLGKSMHTEDRQHVIVVGAGPVALVTANLLADAGIAVTLVEAASDLPRDLRASTFHPPTLDMLERFGVVHSMIGQGLICPTWQFRDRNEGVVATFELARLASDTAHPYRLQCEQWRLGEMLFARLEQNARATIRLGTRAVDARQTANGVELEVEPSGGGPKRCTVHFSWAPMVSAVVRKAIDADFDGITIPELYLTLSTTYDFRETMPDLANISYSRSA